MRIIFKKDGKELIEVNIPVCPRINEKVYILDDLYVVSSLTHNLNLGEYSVTVGVREENPLSKAYAPKEGINKGGLNKEPTERPDYRPAASSYSPPRVDEMIDGIVRLNGCKLGKLSSISQITSTTPRTWDLEVKEMFHGRSIFVGAQIVLNGREMGRITSVGMIKDGERGEMTFKAVPTSGAKIDDL